ncbi:MAG: sigma 54-interacting transcriptional regulator, partial [Deltaproteobacteria bacterium]|nr:sigma 54-interacting transcriptional regulator [Deltaproteobacteria bacterium]
AGAVLEEATYRTGEASACVDLGELEAAIDTARRAALLWEEVLAQPGMAARAWLARAGAYAAINARHEAIFAAEHALERAEDSDDPRAAAYALWAVADACDAGDPSAAAAATRAADLIGPQLDDDGLWAAARVERHAPATLTDHQRHAADEAARGGKATLAAYARLDWWGARAETAATAVDEGSSDPSDGQLVLAQLAALAEADAPVWARGKAMHAACRLAVALGDTGTLPRVEAARRRAANQVVAGTTSFLAEPARACRWLGRHPAGETAAVDVEQALDLEKLVRTLSERRNLRALLDQVIDVLLLWTGAERGLLLMSEAGGPLQPRSARNLGHDDLSGDQLTVSSSLAQRALETGEPVVAVDAMEELSRSYSSVHALKLRSVLVLPLIAHGEVLGVAYLDDRIRRGAFGDKEIRWAQTVAPLAALAIADARTQDSLRRAVKRAEDASQKLEQNLARKETALDVAERELARAVGSQDTRFRYDDIVGQSEPMRRLLSLVDRVATSDVPVLIRGESGSGKELVARAVHRGSPRASQAFVGESCGALPETLLESTLFGHVKGAFTGAHRPRSGLFEAADQGTLFLDEIGEMSLGMQTKLLRVLEDSIVRPVGSTRPRKVDVRIIAATHRDLEKMVAEGTFREDLYYRINVIAVQIPPLRERASDIPLLVDHLLAKHAPGRQAKVTAAARRRLMGCGWPGNVRQLENEVRRALLLSDDQIDVEHLSIPSEGEDADVDLGFNIRARIDRLETELASQALERTGGNQTQAAKLLGLSRYGLHKMMKRLGISAR